MKKFFLMLAILFLCGIVSADICVGIIKDSDVLMDLEIYKNYANAKLIYKDVFWNVLYERLKLFAFLGLLCFTPVREFLGILFAGIFSFIWGFFMMSCITQLGLAGVVVGISSVLPHGLLYGGLMVMMLAKRGRVRTYSQKGNMAVYIMSCIVMLLLFVTGCVLESLVSTHFIPWVIRLSLI